MTGGRWLGRLACASLALAVCGSRPSQADPAQLERGAYIFAAAGCAACHTNVREQGALLAGGRALKTPFGTFYSPNITADPVHGIGQWTDADFVRALREGIGPDGTRYYPVFPYTSFTGMTEADMLDLKAYIFSLPPVAQPNKPHDVSFPYSWRFTLRPWRWLNFSEGEFQPDPQQSAAWNRGAYLVNALGHCGECHTPRGWLGGLDSDEAFAGAKVGPEGGKVPNITSDPATGIGSWSKADITGLLKNGILPDGDVVGSTMGEVVTNSTSRLTQEDRAAIAEYLMSLPPVENPDAKAVKAE